MLRRLFPLVAIAFIAVVAGPLPPGVRVLAAQESPTAEELVARNLTAKGGLDKWKTVETMKQTVHAVSQGSPAEITMYGKRPNMQRQEVSAQGQLMVSAFDGQTAWMISPQLGPDPVTMSGMQAQMTKDQSDFDGPLVNYKGKGSTIELVGKETTDGVPTYHLKLSRRATGLAATLSPPPPIEHVYLDTITFLEKKIVSESTMGGMAMKIETDFADYKTVEGVTLPFSIKTRSNGILAVEMTVTKVQFNVALDDAFFRMPIK